MQISLYAFVCVSVFSLTSELCIVRTLFSDLTDFVFLLKEAQPLLLLTNYCLTARNER